MAIFKMAKTVISNTFHKPATRLYPIVKRDFYDNTRGKLGIDIATCIFCGMCQRKCPADAITVSRQEKTWAVEPFNCISCGNCVDACPKKCLFLDNHYTTPDTTKTREEFKNTEVPENSASNE